MLTLTNMDYFPEYDINSDSFYDRELAKDLASICLECKKKHCSGDCGTFRSKRNKIKQEKRGLNNDKIQN